MSKDLDAIRETVKQRNRKRLRRAKGGRRPRSIEGLNDAQLRRLQLQRLSAARSKGQLPPIPPEEDLGRWSRNPAFQEARESILLKRLKLLEDSDE